MKRKSKNAMRIGDDYLKIQKKLNREIELERNGGRWIAIDRPHKNKKIYNRKRDKKIKYDNLPLFFYMLTKVIQIPFNYFQTAI